MDEGEWPDSQRQDMQLKVVSFEDEREDLKNMYDRPDEFCSHRQNGMSSRSMDTHELRFSRSRSMSISSSCAHLPVVRKSFSSVSDKVADWAFWFEMKDHDMVTVSFALLAIFVAAVCGVAAYLLHAVVHFAGCLGGTNGCHKQILLDSLETYGITKSIFFVVASCLSGLACSLIIKAPFQNRIAKKCKGGGSAGTKIVISAGQWVSGWVPLLRVLLAAIYLGGGNTLGSEGPIIHLSSSLATWLIHMVGFENRKMLSMFAVVGAAAGISAGFNVQITGVVFVIEELTRSLSKKSALIITLGTGVATLIRMRVADFMHQSIHMERPSMVPSPENWSELTDGDIQVCLLLCLPIGILNGVAGWAFTRCAWHAQVALGKTAVPDWLHLAIIGLFSGCLGVLVYEVSGVNGVWGTTMDVVPETLVAGLAWQEVLLMFFGKFCAMTLATAGGGPGGTLVPSLTAGGLVGILVGRIASSSEPGTAACAVIGMGSLFASLMHMPVTGVVIISELTGAKDLFAHVIFANFVATNVTSRLPNGQQSFVHLALAHDPVWLQLGGQDFIETDEQEKNALNNVGIGRLLQFKTAALRLWLMPANVLLKLTFRAWHKKALATGQLGRNELVRRESQRRSHMSLLFSSNDETMLRLAWGALATNRTDALKIKVQASAERLRFLEAFVKPKFSPTSEHLNSRMTPVQEPLVLPVLQPASEIAHRPLEDDYLDPPVSSEITLMTPAQAPTDLPGVVLDSEFACMWQLHAHTISQPFQ